MTYELVLTRAQPARCAFRYCTVLVFPAVAVEGTFTPVREAARQRYERERIVAWLAAGETRADLARRLAITPQALGDKMRRWGIAGADDRTRFCCEPHRLWENVCERRDTRALDRATRPLVRRQCAYPPCSRMFECWPHSRRVYCQARCRRKAECARKARGPLPDDTCEMCEGPIDRLRRRADSTVCSERCRRAKTAMQRDALRAKRKLQRE